MATLSVLLQWFLSRNCLIVTSFKHMEDGRMTPVDDAVLSLCDAISFAATNVRNHFFHATWFHFGAPSQMTSFPPNKFLSRAIYTVQI